MKLRIGIVILSLLLLNQVYAQAQEAPVQTPAQFGGITYREDFKVFGLALAAALTMGLAAVGAGYAIGHAGAAAMGAIAEKPEVSTWGLIIVALAEGIALYGLVVAFMLIGKL